MELRLFPLLIGIAIGAVTGAKGKSVVKSMAKAYLAVEEKTKGMMADMREGMRDVVEEARYEREQEAALREQSAAAMHEGEAAAPGEQGMSPQAASRGTAAVAAPPMSGGA